MFVKSLVFSEKITVEKMAQEVCFIEELEHLRNTAVIMNMKNEQTDLDIDRIVEMAWEDRTPFDAIKFQFKISEQEVIEIMRKEMKASSFRMWRKRVQGRSTKHLALNSIEKGRFKCSRQRAISNNKVAKR